MGVSTVQVPDEGPQVLRLSTGEQFPLTNTDEVIDDQTVKMYQVAQQNLITFTWTFDTYDPGSGASYYWIAHKSGKREYVAVKNGKGYTTELYTPAGHKLTLSWDIGDGDEELPYSLLYSVQDNLGNVLLQTDGYEPGGVSFNFMQSSTDEAYDIAIGLSDGAATGVTIDAPGCDTQSWAFTNDYLPSDPDGLWGKWIVGLNGPGGYSETAEYTLTHQFPSGGPEYMPCVETFTRTPGGGHETMVSTYSYSPQNYLGGASDGSIPWRTDVDPMLAAPFSSYTYSSTETRQSSTSPAVTITRTYNQFHLQTQVDTMSGANTHTALTTYDISPGEPSDSQPAWYQLPQTKTNSWNGANAETSTFKWDEYGNQLEQHDPDGLVTRWQYYPASGSGGDCPEEPNGFVRFVQWKIVDPSQVTDASWLHGKARVQQKNYKYDTQETFPGATQPLILPIFSQTVSADAVDQDGNLTSPTPLSESTYVYWSSTGGYQGSDEYDAGRLYNVKTTHYANDGTGATFDSSSSYDYQYLDGSDPDFPFPNGVKTKHTLQSTGVDGATLSVTDTKVASGFTGNTLMEIDSQGNHTSYKYDALGRQVQRILDGDKPDYTNILQCTYHIDPTGRAPFQVTQTDIKFNKIRYTSDGLGRPYKIEVNNPDSGDISQTDDTDINFTISAKVFDGLGRLWTDTSYDYAFDPFLGQQEYTAVRTMSYDGWGQVNAVTHSNGLIEHSEYDPVARTLSVWHSSTIDDTVTGKEVTYFDYNATRKPYKIERHKVGSTDSPYSTVYKYYDGLHRLTQVQTPANTANGPDYVTQYTYDDWHRVKEITLPDNTIVVRGYSPDSPEKRVTDIHITQVPGDRTTLVSPGAREYDAFGRVRRKWLGKKKLDGTGRLWKYEYEKHSDTRPTTVVDPDKISRIYTYDPRLGEAMSTVTTSNNIGQSFFYDHQSGLLRDAIETGSVTWKYDTFPSGRLKTETYGDTQTTVGYTYTLSGAPYSYKHADNAVQTITRDATGRVKSISDGTVTVTPVYDGINRIRGWQATSGTHTLTTDLGGYLLADGKPKPSDYLDDFGRETKRVIQDSVTNNKWVIEHQWNRNDLLIQRAVNFNNTPQYEVDLYVYDSRNRMTYWDSVGPSRPMDRYGNSLSAQGFHFDGLNNITWVTMQFNGRGTTANKTIFKYENPDDPCLLTGGTNTHPSYPQKFQVTYDDEKNRGDSTQSGVTSGRIIDDGMGTTFSYDDLGRVANAGSTLTKMSGSYTYDAHNRLSAQSIQGQPDAIQFYYRANVLVNLIQGNNQVRLFQSSIGGAAAQINTGENAGSWLLGLNNQGSVVSASDGTTTNTRMYSPYGEEKIQPSS
ncbi:hypothetical protein CAL14_12335 [Bordetella genomosp. 9]|nr:hypothetical protein CAL14_12335 [Bordetella genomosp. 9]